MSNNVPVLMLRGEDGKFFPVDGITGGGTGGGGTGTGGITPHIGANGNWYIGDIDTGKPSRGEKGDTPVKGVDYWTEADKQEIIQAVLAAMPDGTEVSY